MSSPFEFRPEGNAEAFRNAHKSSDTDAERLSMHHTLGAGATQAAPGNHNHDSDYADISHNHSGTYSPFDARMEVGFVVEYPVGAIGAKYLEFNGQSVLRSAYPDLFALWGTTFGAVDGTHFNVGPVTADKFAIGTSGTKAVGTTGGSATTALPNHVHSDAHTHDISHTHTMAHDHSISAVNHDGNVTSVGGGTQSRVARVNGTETGSHNHGGTTGASSAANTGAASTANSGARSAANTGNPTTNPNIAIDPPWYATRKIVRALP